MEVGRIECHVLSLRPCCEEFDPNGMSELLVGDQSKDRSEDRW